MTTSTPAAPRHLPSRRSPRSSVPAAATALMTFGVLVFASMAPPLTAAALNTGVSENLGLRGKNMVKDDAADICAFDNDCSSGYCTLGLTCGEKIATGDTGCLENDDCLSGYCGILESLPPFECKASEGGQDLGSACITDAACASGSCGYSSWSCLRCCTGTMPPTPAPTAAPTTAAPTTAAPTTPLTPAPTAPLLDPGSGCLFDSQCASGNCGYSSWRCPSCCIEG